MKKINTLPGLLVLALVLVSCKCGPFDTNQLSPSGNTSPTPTPTPIGDITSSGATKKRAYRITGNIDDARQEGNVCDTSKVFKVPGTLEFEFKPSSPTKGEYTYSGAFNASGSGPYEINDDGKMILDGTGCIMGRCATYSHEWKAVPIDPATCKEGK